VLGQRLQSFVGPCELFEEQQDFHVRPIVDAGSHHRLVKSYKQGMKEHHHVGTCKQEHQVCTGFVDVFEASATDHVDRPWCDSVEHVESLESSQKDMSQTQRMGVRVNEGF